MKSRFNWRHQYDEQRDEKEGDISALRCEDPSLTVQSFAQDADLNEIARRFGINDIPTVPISTGEPYDNSYNPELRDVLEAQRQAKDHFLALPARLRKRFHNNPAELWQFVTDPDNAEEAIRLGLLTAPKDAPPANTTTTSTTSAPATTSTTTTKGEENTPPPKPPVSK